VRVGQLAVIALAEALTIRIYTHRRGRMYDDVEQPKRPHAFDPLLTPKRPKWARPEWWKPEYDEIAGARYYTEKELKAKLTRKRYSDKQKAIPKPPSTPEQIVAKELKRAEGRVKEMHTKINTDRARLMLYESLYSSPTLPEWEKVAMPFKIQQLRELIPVHEATLARRETALATLKGTS
jgi:hypothetical protein